VGTTDVLDKFQMILNHPLFRARKALWDSFEASVASASQTKPEHSTKATVKIEKRYRFAGEIVV